jgi:hypothetical protein
MKKRKKLIIFLLLAINSLVSATTNISGKLKTTYSRLYKNIFKNSKPDNTGSENLKFLEETLVNRNIELREIYIQNSQKRPEYLEWLIFSGNFPNGDINNMLRQSSDESVRIDYNYENDEYKENILSVLAANVQRRWDRKSFNDNFIQIIEKSLERDDKDSYLELIESTQTSALSDELGLVSAKAYIKGSTLPKKEKNMTDENNSYNKPLSIYISDTAADFSSEVLKFSDMTGAEKDGYSWFNNGEVKVQPVYADNMIFHSIVGEKIQPDTNYILEYHNDYIGYGINYENKNEIKSDNKVIKNVINFMNDTPQISVGEYEKFIFDTESLSDEMGYRDNKKGSSIQLNEALASFDAAGNLVISLHGSGTEFFEPFIMENKLLNKEKDFLSISEEVASAQNAKIKNEKAEEYEVLNSRILFEDTENSSKVIENSMNLLGELKDESEKISISDTLDMSLNYYTLSGIIDNKPKHIYSYLNYGVGNTLNPDEIIPKARYEMYMVNDRDLRNDLIERLNRSQMFSSGNRRNDNRKEYRSSWKPKAALDFT